jgi:glycerophosphoryl diester phosphodiesterase
MKKVQVLAHRGYRAKYPENSLLAFRKGFEAGADGLECDVQKTKDGRFVIIHDGTVDRTSKNKMTGEVGAMTLRQLRNVNLGKGERIPELVEFLKSIPSGKLVNIELKDETLTPSDSGTLCDIFLNYIEQENLLVSSFDHSLLPVFAERNVMIGLLIGNISKKTGLFRLLIRILSMKPESMNLPIGMFDTAGKIPSIIILRLFRLLGTRIFFWTVNTEDQFRNACRYGDGIITDEVEFILELIKKNKLNP